MVQQKVIVTNSGEAGGRNGDQGQMEARSDQADGGAQQHDDRHASPRSHGADSLNKGVDVVGQQAAQRAGDGQGDDRHEQQQSKGLDEVPCSFRDDLLEPFIQQGHDEHGEDDLDHGAIISGMQDRQAEVVGEGAVRTSHPVRVQ